MMAARWRTAVEVLYEDDGFKPEVGKQKTEKLIESDKVDFISATSGRTCCWRAQPVVDSKPHGHRQRGSLADRRELCSPYVFSTS